MVGVYSMTFESWLNSRIQIIQRLFTVLSVLFICIYLTSSAAAQSVFSNTTSGAITDNNCGTAAQITRTFNVPTNLVVADINFGFFATHTYRSDLRITLTSPAGTTVTLLTWVGNVQDGDNYNDLLDDQAAAAIGTHNSAVNDPLTPAPLPYSHSFRPSNPLSAFNGQNAVGNWTMVLCDAVGSDTGTFTRADLFITAVVGQVNVVKTSSTLSDGVSAANPKSVPGAVTRYCILITNTGATASTNIVANDALPANLTFVLGSMRSGTSCATAATVEDDNNIGTDETDPVGASITGTNIRITSPSLAAGSTFAVTFNAIIN